MKAPQQGFAKGFSGDEETIKGQEMPGGEGGEQPATTDETGASAEGGDPAVVIALAPTETTEDAGQVGGEGGEGGDSDTAAVEAGAAGAFPEAGEGEPEMKHSEKSWNGRLTAREKELKARADELDARAAEIDSQKLPTYDEAVSQLSEDFGEDFVKLIQVVAAGAGKDGMESNAAELREKIDSITEGVRAGFGQVHSEMISSAHEDFEDIAASEEFKAYIDALPDDEKAAAMQVIEEGSPRQVVKLLNAFKKTLSTEGNDDTKYDAAALDAAAGVRSAGGRAPSLGGDAVAAGGEVDRFRAGFNA